MEVTIQNTQKQEEDRIRSQICLGNIEQTQSSWSLRSYKVALLLEERGEWPLYLTAAELPLLTKALESTEQWDQFISPQSNQWYIKIDSAALSLSAKHTSTRQSPDLSSLTTEKRPAPSDGNSSEKRAKTDHSLTPLVSDDDDELSALSSSDIDMGNWTAEGSVAAPNAVSPGLTTDIQLPKSTPISSNSNGGGNQRTPAALTTKEDTGCHSAEVEVAERSLVSALAAFHARAAIYERYASVLCGSNENCKQCEGTVVATKDITKIEKVISGDNSSELDIVTENTPLTIKPPSPPAPLVTRNLDEDEDYDDDDDDDGGGNEKKEDEEESTQPTIPNGSMSSSMIADSNEIGKKEPNGIVVKQPSLVVNSGQLRSIFHTLDELADVVRNQDIHEGNVRQIKEVMEYRAAEPRDMLANKIGALQNMKNLAQFIDSHRDSVSMSTRELSHLLSEVRPKRTKWANERRIGQIELYEALEHVLNELKGMGNVALPFLSQVKRKDAPDYYKVISHPMDLGSMTKNLRNEVYNSKKQFADHLQLIRDNCYAYNTEPGNYYRQSADSLLKKAKSLMESVANITIRERGGMGGNNNIDDAMMMENGDDSGSESLGVVRFGYGQREGSAMLDEGTPAPGSVFTDYNNSFGSSSNGGSALIIKNSLDPSILPPSVTIDSEADEEGDIREQQPANDSASDCQSRIAQNIHHAMQLGSINHISISSMVDGYDLPLRERIWRGKARRRVAQYVRRIDQRLELTLGDQQIPDERTAEAMQRFLETTHDKKETICEQDMKTIEGDADITDLRVMYAQVPGSKDVAEARRRNEELDEARKLWLQAAEEVDGREWEFVDECEIAAGFPQLETVQSQANKDGVLQWLNEDCEKVVDVGSASIAQQRQQRPSLEAYAAARFPSSSMWQDMAGNIERLRGIRRIDNKIWAAKLNIPMDMLHLDEATIATERDKGRSTNRVEDDEDEDSPGRPSLKDLHRDFANKPDPLIPFNMDANGARNMLQRTSAFMLAHAGFNSVTGSAMSTLVDFLIDYISNLGRTLRTYSDKHGRTMSTEAIVAHSLYENGVEDLGELEYYMRGEIGRYKNKLVDLGKKLTKSYQDVMNEGKADESADLSMLENDQSFMTGSVGGLGDLGEDFFGFKELGLDKEFGLDQLTVPQRLWHGKKAAAAQDPEQTETEEVSAHPEPKSWSPITTPKGQIGLLHKFLCEKIMEANNGACPPGYEELVAVADNTDQEQRKQLPEQWQPVQEDESISGKARYGSSRPKQPPPNYLTHPRTHMYVGSGKSATKTAGRASKKKPAKTTASKKK